MIGRTSHFGVVGVAGLLVLSWLAACSGGSGKGNTSPATDSAGAGAGAAGASGGGAVSPTRACVLDKTCGTCVGDSECWEGFPAGDCPSFIEGARYVEQTCPDLGFPVNCTGDNKFQPEGAKCSGASGGSSGASGGETRSEGDVCTSSTECPSGTQCEHYLGNAANPMRCMRKCMSHAQCPGTQSPDFTLPLAACDFCDGGPDQCVPLNVCGYSGGSSSTCDDCLASCRGLSSCCTGCGCICESECSGC